MSVLKTRPLTKIFGVEIQDVNLSDVTADHLFPEIRAAFEKHSVLLFRHQQVTAEQHKRLATLFGPIEDREAGSRDPGEEFEIEKVSNVAAHGAVSAEMDPQALNLKANQLWHTDSTFMPNPALVNILIAEIVTKQGGETELATTRAAWRDLPADLKAKIEQATCWHNGSHSRAKISTELSKRPEYNKWDAQRWKPLWRNPINGEEALYIASHIFKIDGMETVAAQELVDELIDFCTQPKYIYTHTWAVGDVLIWDERATLHRGRPWPYDQPRSLSSILSTATIKDGVESIRIA